MKSKFKNYFKSVFSNFSNFWKIISREIRENNYFEFSRRTQSSLDMLLLSFGLKLPQSCLGAALERPSERPSQRPSQRPSERP
jgi:hypothetical protein